MTGLNEPQKAAVAHSAGPLLVFAGAGSGKTRVITYRIANLIAEHNVAPHRILAVTFTNKAAGEMRERLDKLAGAAVTRDLWVGTFHAICAKLLRRYYAEVGLEKTFVIYDDSDQKAVLKRVMRAADTDERAYPPKQVLGRIHRQKRQGLGPADVRVSRSFDSTLVVLYEGYEKAMRIANAVDFEDLILLAVRIVENKESAAAQELKERFDHVMVDEFQDTNTIQYRLVRALAARHENLCVVGDDDQSIYSWRGANVTNIRGFHRDFPEAKIVKLEQNYRSTGNIVRSALAVIAPARDREPKKLWTAQEPGEPVHVRRLSSERLEAAEVLSVIQRSLRRDVPANEIAVFYRIHAQSRVLEEALRSEGIPYQIIGGMKFFERAEIKTALAYLRLIDNPRSDADLIRVINTPTRGIGQKTVERIMTTASARSSCGWDAIDTAVSELGAGPKKKVLAFQGLIQKLREVAERAGPHELITEVLERTGFRELLRRDDSAEADARLENLEELRGSILEYEKDTAEAGEEPNLASYLERVALVSVVDTMDDAPKVALMTVHAAKGLEFHTVCLTGMEEEVFPYRGIDGDSPEELEEERRLAYVAITRARTELHISHASTRMIFGQTRYLAPSRFLADLPPDATEFHESAYEFERPPPNRNPRPERSRYSSSSRPEAPRYEQSTRLAWRSPEAETAPTGEPSLAEGEQVVDYDAFDDIPPDQGVEIRKGSKVMHKRFGKGIVESVENDGNVTVVARFRGFGTRKVLAQYLSPA